MAFSGNSKLVLTETLNVSLVKNQATNEGGTIFFADAISTSQCIAMSDLEECFLELSYLFNIYLNFINNTAGNTGKILYGGSLDRCRLYVGGGSWDKCGNRIGGTYYDFNPLHKLQNISAIVSDDSVTSDISSDPLQVCICEGDRLECKDHEMETVRGREFTLLATTVGQNDGIVPSSVRISLKNNVQINAVQRIQSTGKMCTPITYRLFTGDNTTTFTLFPESGLCRDIGIFRRQINIKFLPCPDSLLLKDQNVFVKIDSSGTPTIAV